MTDLLIKDNKGNFIPSAAGENKIYFNTISKLLKYYLVKIANLNTSEVDPIMAKLPELVKQNFQTPADYQKKLSLFSSLIQNYNPENFKIFLSKNFAATILKEKEALFHSELETAKAKFDNPLWVPSINLIVQFSEIFYKANALDLKKIQNNNLLENIQTPTPAQEKKITQEEPGNIDLVENLLTSMPGKIILENLSSQFIKTEKINLNKFIIDREINDEETSPPPIVSPVTDNLPNPASNIPGKILYEKFLTHFSQSPSFDYSHIGTLNSSSENHQIQFELTKIISLKNFIQLLNKVNFFKRNSDQSSYNTWYADLSKEEKISLQTYFINSKSEVEKRNEKMKMAKIFHVDINFVEEIEANTVRFLKINFLLKKIINILQDKEIDKESIQNVYRQLVTIMDNDEQPQNKILAANMIFLQFSDESIISMIENDLKEMVNLSTFQ